MNYVNVEMHVNDSVECSISFWNLVKIVFSSYYKYFYSTQWLHMLQRLLFCAFLRAL